jgi:hypothetical protein
MRECQPFCMEMQSDPLVERAAIEGITYERVPDNLEMGA